VIEQVLLDCFNLVGEGEGLEIISGLSASYVKAFVHKGFTKTCAEVACPAGEIACEVRHSSSPKPNLSVPPSVLFYPLAFSAINDLDRESESLDLIVH
jgi:hypothetical protein